MNANIIKKDNDTVVFPKLTQLYVTAIQLLKATPVELLKLPSSELTLEDLENLQGVP